jgi:UDP-N-acetylglucosamine 2-epimerase (hydrolysing)
MNQAQRKRILFLSGTRADFGKLKPLIREVQNSARFDYAIFATGMHLLSRYGSTLHEIEREGFENIFSFINQDSSVNSQMDLVLANTVHGLGHYVREFPPDLIVVHGDRIETLAGAIVGTLNNILVAHIEGGELSGTVDELIRHSVSKLAHLHFVSNHEARQRLIQMGEPPERIFVTGSPDIDIMLSDDLPPLEQVHSRYDIPFRRYGVFLYHPVTTELAQLDRYLENVLHALRRSGLNWTVIYPNNDQGSERILAHYETLRGEPNFRVVPSMRFEYFLVLLRNAVVIAGNSSAAIREAPVYGVPAINIGTRQMNRFRYDSILDVPEDCAAILNALQRLPQKVTPSLHFGKGQSAKLFMAELANAGLWEVPRQKQFRDMDRQAYAMASAD